MRKKFAYPILLVATIVVLFVLLNNSKAESPLKSKEENIVENINTTSLSEKEDLPSEITLDSGSGKSFKVPISSIPDLEKYLDEETDIKTELERIQVEYLNWNMSNENYFVLNYGCGNIMCDLVLIQISELNEVKTIHLGNGIFTGDEVFEGKAMFRIAEKEGSTVLRHQINIVDLNTMASVHPTDKRNNENYFNSPLYPIPEFKWITADAIELDVADIPDTTYESIEKWYSAASPAVKSLKITIK